jgi:Domain of Unknown Function (DUF1080)
MVHRNTWRGLFVATLLAVISATALPAQEPGKSDVRAAGVEADFAVQGEYVGQVRTPIWGRTSVGLQVVALGKGGFNARLYYGGLPGQGAILGVCETWRGATGSDGVVLWSGKRGMRIASPNAWVYDEQGGVEGTLTRVERKSSTLGLPAPRGAAVLFDGEAHQLKDAKIENGLLQTGAMTEFPVKDFRLHLEFRTPFTPEARDQGRGNSGVYIQRRYEVQILDSFGLEGKFNECGSLYRQTPPDFNMAFPPMTWQTYDIEFSGARFDACGQRVCPARITLFHNGVAVHYQREIASKTGAGQAEGAEPLPILFQNHRDKVEFRNIWLVPNG